MTKSSYLIPCIIILFLALAKAQDLSSLPVSQDPCPHSEWSCWSACSEPCGGGNRTRTRQILKVTLPLCDTIPTHQCKECNTEPCPTDCFLDGDDFGDWGACSASCGGGLQNRSRLIKTMVVKRTGKNQICPPSFEERVCNVHACPIDCQVSEWSDWSPCSATCGEAVQSRTRSIQMFPQNSGEKCPDLTETRDCDTFSCDLEQLRWKCETMKRSTFLTPSGCPNYYVFCPGNGKNGVIGKCGEGSAFHLQLNGCRPENQVPACGAFTNPWAGDPWWQTNLWGGDPQWQAGGEPWPQRPWGKVGLWAPPAPPQQTPIWRKPWVVAPAPPIWNKPFVVAPPPANPPPPPSPPVTGGRTPICTASGGLPWSGSCSPWYWWCDTAGPPASLERCSNGDLWSRTARKCVAASVCA